MQGFLFPKATLSQKHEPKRFASPHANPILLPKVTLPPKRKPNASPANTTPNSIHYSSLSVTMLHHFVYRLGVEKVKEDDIKDVFPMVMSEVIFLGIVCSTYFCSPMRTMGSRGNPVGAFDC